MKTVTTHPVDRLIPQFASLVRQLLPAPRFVVTRHDEPCEDCDYATEEEALERAEAMDEADKHGRSHEVAPLSLTLTVGATVTDGEASYGWQTGDNSFTGGAYGYPAWAVVWLSADSDPEAVAAEIADELAEALTA